MRDESVILLLREQVTNNEIYGEETTPPKRAARFDPNSLSPTKQGSPVPNSPQFKKLSKHEQRAQRMRQELLGRNPNYIQRFPEDLLHDEFEAGQAVSWTVIGENGYYYVVSVFVFIADTYLII